MRSKLVILVKCAIFLTLLTSVICVMHAREVSAATPARVYVDPAATINRTLVPGSLFNVSVKIENIDVTPGLAGMGFNLTWDATLFEATNMTEVMFHEATPENESDNILALRHVIDNTTGEVQYDYTWVNITRAIEAGYGPISGNRTVATIEFQVKSTGYCKLSFTGVEIRDENGLLIPQGWNAIDGSFSNIPGDLDGSGVVDIFDAIMMASAFGSDSSSGNWDPNADMNGDGEVDIYDAILIGLNFSHKK